MVSDPSGSGPVGAPAAADNSNCAIFYFEERISGGFNIRLLETDEGLSFGSLVDGMCFSSFS